MAEKKTESNKLVRGLGLLDATMIVIGSMIGSGIFITSAESARLIGAPGWLLVAWALAGFMTITGALCCAELAAMMPRAGGPYVFLRRSVRSRHSGSCSAGRLFLVVQTGTIAAVAVAFANFPGVLIKGIDANNYLIAPRRLGGYALSLSTAQLVADRDDRCPDAYEHARPEDRQAHPKHFHVHQDGRADRTDRSWPAGRLEQRQRSVHIFVVGLRGPTVGIPQAAQPGLAIAGRLRPGDDAGPGDDRTAVLAISLEQRDVYRRRNRESRPQPASVALHRLRSSRRALPAGEPGLRRHFAARGNPRRAAEPRCGRN